MIILYNRWLTEPDGAGTPPESEHIIIPRIRKGRFEDGELTPQYQVILQHSSTKDVTLYTCENLSRSPLYYKFNLDFSGVNSGEHRYYVASYDGWELDDINVNNPLASTRRIMLDQYTFAGLTLRSNGKIILTGHDGTQQHTSEDMDNPPTLVSLVLLATGILKITECAPYTVTHTDSMTHCEYEPNTYQFTTT